MILQPVLDEAPSAEQAWKNDYPWLQQAFAEIGPGARRASDGWRVRIENELKTTLDFKVRQDGTAAVWCGMSAYDFRHDPPPKELFEGLAEAYRRERKRVGGGSPWKMSAVARPASPRRPKPQPPARAALAPPPEDSLARAVGALLLSHVEQLTLIFLAVTGLTLLLASIAVVVS